VKVARQPNLEPMPEDTEAKIFRAAEEEFVARGYKGARMQHIADQAGINKSLLHYYYRSKEKLFRAVFSKTAEKVFPKIPKMWGWDVPLIERMERFVDGYIDILLKNPMLPSFVMHELQQNPGQLVSMFGDLLSFPFQKVKEEILRSMESGEIRKTDPEHLLANVVGLCVFPFVARPMLEKVTGMSKEEFDQFLIDRKQHVKEFIHRALAP